MIKEKISQVYNSVEMFGFSLHLDWSGRLGCKYLQYFNDADKKIRAGSTFAYLGMLHSWLESSSFAFLPDTGKEFKDCYHQFDDYLKEFLRNSESIANEFPEMHQHIVQALYELDVEMNIEKTFPHIKKNLFNRMRDELFSDGMTVRTETFRDYDGVFKELGFNKGYF